MQKIKDSEQTPFQLQDLVWAKLQNYPWWPGKIIEIASYKKILSFKISFYADPTYCYVPQNSVIAFRDFDYSLNNSYKIDSVLEKAINLANKAYQKIIQRQIKNINTAEHQMCIELNKYQMQQEISEENSLKIEEQDQSTICYVKQTSNLKKLTQQQQIQQIRQLLAKYKLDNIPELQTSQKINKSKLLKHKSSQSTQSLEQYSQTSLKEINEYNPKKIPRKNLIRKCKKPQKLSSQKQQVLFMKKLNHLLIHKNIQPIQSRQITMKISQKIKQAIQVENVTNNKNKSIRIKFLQMINHDCYYDMNIQDLLENIQRQFLNQDKHQDENQRQIEDEEKSKFTHVLSTSVKEKIQQLQTLLIC